MTTIRSTTRKTLVAALAAATLSGALIGVSDSASAAPWGHRHHGHFRGVGWGIGGLAAGAILGSALAARPAYADEVECRMVERVNRRGEVIGVRKVCDVY